jgi:hypothetical protein
VGRRYIVYNYNNNNTILNNVYSDKNRRSVSVCSNGGFGISVSQSVSWMLDDFATAVVSN